MKWCPITMLLWHALLTKLTTKLLLQRAHKIRDSEYENNCDSHAEGQGVTLLWNEAKHLLVHKSSTEFHTTAQHQQ